MSNAITKIFSIIFNNITLALIVWNSIFLGLCISARFWWLVAGMVLILVAGVVLLKIETELIIYERVKWVLDSALEKFYSEWERDGNKS